tara:strand:+ start:976 stop:1167 length:192 start_codon:yes stop_codon:yes gene_type:complete
MNIKTVIEASALLSHPFINFSADLTNDIEAGKFATFVDGLDGHEDWDADVLAQEYMIHWRTAK